MLPRGCDTVKSAMIWYLDQYEDAKRSYEHKKMWERWEQCLRKKIRMAAHLTRRILLHGDDV